MGGYKEIMRGKGEVDREGIEEKTRGEEEERCKLGETRWKR